MLCTQECESWVLVFLLLILVTNVTINASEEGQKEY